MSYRITHEIKPGCQAIIFEFDQDSAQDLFRDFSQLEESWRACLAASSVVECSLVSPPVALDLLSAAASAVAVQQSIFPRQADEVCETLSDHLPEQA